MNPFSIMQVVNQYKTIKQNPNQLVNLLQNQGIINNQQADDIKKMNGNYEQIGQYLMNNGRMPTNIQQRYQSDIGQIQNMINQ